MTEPLEYLFHGTSTENLPGIKATGLLAPVFLGSPEIADYYADTVVEDIGGQPLVIAISLADLDVASLR